MCNLSLSLKDIQSSSPQLNVPFALPSLFESIPFISDHEKEEKNIDIFSTIKKNTKLQQGVFHSLS